MQIKHLLFACILIMPNAFNASGAGNTQNGAADKIDALKETLKNMESQTNIALFKKHCQSVIAVIDAKSSLTSTETNLLGQMYDRFINTAEDGCAMKFDSYLARQRYLVIAWESPADGNTSFGLLQLPQNWDINKSYPVYIQLHGLWNVADSRVDFMSYYFRNNPSTSFAFEDGYQLLPWGRGNFWYEDISGIDVLEALDELKTHVKIDETRQYLSGHSMGGYGAWLIGSQTVDKWAALGMHAAAIWYKNNWLLGQDFIHTLSRMPVYFVCGTNDNLLSVNEQAYDLLRDEGNSDLEFVTFEGGHEYVQENVENMYLWLHQYSTNGYVLVPSLKKGRDLTIEPVTNIVKQNAVFKIYPNRAQMAEIKIYNLSGECLASKITYVSNAQTIEIETNHFKNGLYVYRAVLGNEPAVSGKILIVK